jgi:hypothetical protein
MSDLPHEAAISITITMRGGYKIDLSVNNPIPVDEVVASLKRAGIHELVCLTSSFNINDDDTEILELAAVFRDPA